MNLHRNRPKAWRTVAVCACWLYIGLMVAVWIAWLVR